MRWNGSVVVYPHHFRVFLPKSSQNSLTTACLREMTDPHYADMKQHKRDYDWLECVTYAHYCIPKKCACSGPITVETDERKTLLRCKDDGLHIRHGCFSAIEEELDELKKQYREEVSLRCKLQYELAVMSTEIKELKKLIMGGR
ncbi:hypothetical protein Bca52824_018489 [Brassica carinata]|uniref:Uncharacterized protein n=1 Tax=Brassica carinata TaxID=52824 RepID=A0A8X8AYK6_BRACI|nr:hypothetical protein Bca52824_018489 [Brassica carinata]